ncbi:uncharacterized protein C8R40DRAFT_1066194 [Lentinula edodes]|uniref:uncharacterized protein n=1 Tax=Lentinula edodes TaxID=5353 RepID=UPI001E8CEAE7|nr:uncharacterized protein C8R40DRAFT_1066194 [Lentinula edodes]KAH7880081.1 hypothetical protein C8R40DRAFT_1066194 [Lentinula edodes]
MPILVFTTHHARHSKSRDFEILMQMELVVKPAQRQEMMGGHDRKTLKGNLRKTSANAFDACAKDWWKIRQQQLEPISNIFNVFVMAFGASDKVGDLPLEVSRRSPTLYGDLVQSSALLEDHEYKGLCERAGTQKRDGCALIKRGSRRGGKGGIIEAVRLGGVPAYKERVQELSKQ